MIPWKIFRQIWVSVTNGLVLYLALPQLIREVRIGHAFDLDLLETTATVAMMSIGIATEIVRSRLAKYINVGYYLLDASRLLLPALAAYLGISSMDPEAGAFSLALGVVFLFVALVNLCLYSPKLEDIKQQL